MKKILVIDDEPFARQVFTQIVQKMGDDIQIIEAADGKEALEKASQEIMDLLIVDINLPFINGIELIKKLREELDYAQTPCVVVTANTSYEVQEKVKDLGAVDVISKIDVSSRFENGNPLVAILKKYL